ncbi:MAG: ring-cleaving dioxygenase [Paenibacillus dendritiformis]|uniref:ring-cleaving dioxygenase n=1 Tax=uncultured Paenibacillus sp. TaxID=227322 RepID=UPI0025F97ADC|nr:ring-cleaving dioxygenase [uncultured Paenibacillus sp.]MDU5145454.1 ring-cleaving dioxygenase [Paenibacillus dendritiformis]
MKKQTTGIHHITAIARNAQENVDFYAGVLGIRLVKKTVNFDAPEVYHFYFGDEAGSPGTIMTFFPWETARKGRVGGGQVGVTTFVVPAGSMDFWEERLRTFHVSTKREARFGEQYLRFSDHDGLQLEIVEREEGPNSKWSFGGVPVDKTIKGFGGAVLYSIDPTATAQLLENVMGLEKRAEEGDWIRFKGSADLGNVIDVNVTPMERGSGGYGTVHHIAWRAKDFEDHEAWRQHIMQEGYHPTPIVDRQYFNAIYFREPGQILFEIATDPPGFTRDEAFEELGSALKLPDRYEARRAAIEKLLPPVQVRGLEGK